MIFDCRFSILDWRRKPMGQLGSRFADNRESKIQNLKFVLLGALLFAVCFPAKAQQSKEIPRIGFLSAASPASMSTRFEAFRQGLLELGYVEGKNIFTD